MEIQLYATARDFLSNIGKFLVQDEARYGLINGLANNLQINPHHYGKDDPWFCSVGDGDDINAVAMRTPPYNVLMEHFSGDFKAIAEQLVKAVAQQYPVIPGLVGGKELGDVFANLWCEKHGIKITFTMALRIHRLDTVNDVPLSSGRLRAATLADKELLEKWFHAFHIDVGGQEANMPEADITPGPKKGWVFLWEDGQPVSMAAKSRPTEKGMNVGAVYTPPELRGRGYATSCVAELSRNILQSGKEFCMLYTDLANPTSNSIYKKIGYKEVGDSVQHMFEIPRTEKT